MHGFSSRDAYAARGYSSGSSRANKYNNAHQSGTSPPSSPTREPEGDTRLADKLYELSLEAEEDAKKRRRTATLQAEKLRDVERERDRLRVQLDEARTEARKAYTAAAESRGASRDREDEYVREIVALRAELAEAQAGRPVSGAFTAAALARSSPLSMERWAATGDELALRGALAPPCVGTKAYNALLFKLLIASCRGAQVGTAKLLLRRVNLLGGDRDPKTGWTALHAAAYSASLDVVDAVLADDSCAPRLAEGDDGELDVDPLDVGCSRGRTALMVAAERGATDVVKALLRAGADAGIVSDPSKGESVTARDLAAARERTATVAALESAGERFWNGSAAGNRAWRRKDFGGALAHFGAALDLEPSLKDPEDSPPSGVDLARLELNCAKAALRLGRATEAAARAEKALDRHRRATRGGAVYPNALAVRAECREALYDFAGAAADFEDLVRLTTEAAFAGAADSGNNKVDEIRQWRDRGRRARDLRDATHYAVLGLPPGADDGEVRKAYRRASMKWHPDRQQKDETASKNGGAHEGRVRAEAHFRRINEAKETLLDSYKRAMYDVENRRRLAAEAVAVDDFWPWQALQAPNKKTTANEGKNTKDPATTKTVAKDKAGAVRRVSVAWAAASVEGGAGTDGPGGGARAGGGGGGGGGLKYAAPFDDDDDDDDDDAAAATADTKEGDDDDDAPYKASPDGEETADEALSESDSDELLEDLEKKLGEPADAREWSWRLQKYEDELKRQREELDRARAARAAASDEREQQEALAQKLEAEVAAAKDRASRRAGETPRSARSTSPPPSTTTTTATANTAAARERRFAKETNGHEAKSAEKPPKPRATAGEGPKSDTTAAWGDDTESSSSAPSGAAARPDVGPIGGRASAFFAPKAGATATDFDFVDDDDDILSDDDDDDDDDNPPDDDAKGTADDEGHAVSEGMMAQLRDAAEWFDHLDVDRTGELDMTHFDELTTRLGLRKVLGDDEMRRQRYFADPVGSGKLRRGTFLGWFAALLEVNDGAAQA